MDRQHSEEWKEFLERGKKWYQYMVSHFDEMFDGNIIKHFTIRDEGVHDLGSEEVMEKHGEDIHKELVKWIHNEYNEGRLFIRSNWRPFHDKMFYDRMYLGYRRMFIYKNY
jgi:hypothetical protein